MHKAIALADAVQKIPDGASVMIGGFLGSDYRRIGAARPQRLDGDCQ
jgi:acyl CoA:acetate/3-ketoacid CoA transferase alpha subunit